MWKCLNKAVPVELTIKKSGIYLASKCICCDYSHEESLDHLMIFSDAAKKVWGFLHRIYGLQFNYQSLYQAAYVWGNCHTSSQLDCLKVLSFTVAVWEIWKWRNKCIHDQPEDSSSIIHKIVHQLQQLNFLIVPSRKAKWSEELAMSSLHLPILLPKAKIGKWISWKSSSQGLTLNFHGMISSNQGQGGFLIRDSKGSILRYHRWSFPRATSSFSASLESLKTAMDIVDAGGWSIAEIQGDSVDFMLCLQGKKSSPWICSDLMVDLRKRCSDIPSKAIEREGNLAAISLAESSGEDDVVSFRKFQTAVREDGSGLRRWSWARL